MNGLLQRQFGHPTGRLGTLAGAVMAIENRRLNRLVVDALGAHEGDRVLEVGCGPGVGLEEAARRAGRVAGVDPSPAMIGLALRRNRAAAEAGRVSVAVAAAEALPYADARFSLAFGINTVQHWTSVRDGLAELYRVLEPGGRFVLARRLQRAGRGLDPHSRGATDDELAHLCEQVAAAGFTQVERHDSPLPRETVALVSGARPGPAATPCSRTRGPGAPR
jgi:ubiquinone/menaquinone biosynthesis C-methylase UbiE